MKPYDVVIIGGGVAGISLAIALRRHGLSIAVVERRSYEMRRIAEILHPETKVPLSALGLWDEFLALKFPPVPGRLSSWGSPQLDVVDDIFNPHGLGWVVDRPRFDRMLAAAAVRREIDLMRKTEIRSVQKRGDGRWTFVLSNCSRISTICSDFAVIATGRASSRLRAPADKRKSYDKLVGIFALVTPPASWPYQDHRPLIEAIPQGWWYSVLLPDGRATIALMTDSDLARDMKREHRLSTAILISQLARAPHTKDRVGKQPRFLTMPATIAANTYRNETIADDRKLLTGDAAFAIDPLSGQGTYLALQSGIRGANAITGHRRNGAPAFREYTTEERKLFERLLADGASYYGLEQRWSDSIFWRRRHSRYNQFDRSTHDAAEDAC